MTITVPASGFIDIEYFKNFLDISKVSWYSLKEKEDVIILKFYDKNKKLIKLNKEIKNDKETKEENCKKIAKKYKKS